MDSAEQEKQKNVPPARWLKLLGAVLMAATLIGIGMIYYGIINRQQGVSFAGLGLCMSLPIALLLVGAAKFGRSAWRELWEEDPHEARDISMIQ